MRKLSDPNSKTKSYDKFKILAQKDTKTLAETAAAKVEKAIEKQVLVSAIVNGSKCEVYVSKAKASELNGQTYIFDSRNEHEKKNSGKKF